MAEDLGRSVNSHLYISHFIRVWSFDLLPPGNKSFAKSFL